MSCDIRAIIPFKIKQGTIQNRILFFLILEAELKLEGWRQSHFRSTEYFVREDNPKFIKKSQRYPWSI